MRVPLLAALALAAAAPLRAQDLATPGTVAAVTGAEFRAYRFAEGFPTRRITQYAAPLAVAVPVGPRFRLDLAASYALTNASTDSARASLEKFTDAQVRASYVFGKDAVVASVMANLPTGPDKLDPTGFRAASAVASNFLLFPINTYSTGFGITGGLAAVIPAGRWNVGLSGSVRWNDRYEPRNDGASYRPGVEGRGRLAVDHLVGRSRLTLGVTVSTFGNDQFSGAGTVNGAYTPGTRVIGEASLAAPVGSGSMTVYAWNFYRASGSSDPALALPANKENVVSVGSAFSFPLGRRVSLDPLVEGRYWSPESGSGWLAGAGVGLRVGVGNRGAVVPSLRVDAGKVKLPSASSYSVTGFGGSVIFRYNL